MVTSKIVLAVALASVAFVQIAAKPAESDTAWAIPFEDALRNLTAKFTDIVGDTSEYATLAKKSLTSLSDNMKTELTALSKTLESKMPLPDMVKEGIKKWETAVDEYSKNIPAELTDVKKFNEKFESMLKYITQQSTELSKKVQGNAELDKTVREFTKKQIDALMEQVKSIQAKFTDKKA